jgi:hypothetical protein
MIKKIVSNFINSVELQLSTQCNFKQYEHMVKSSKLSVEERRDLLKEKNIPYENFLEEYEFLERAKLYQLANPYDKPLYLFARDKDDKGTSKTWVLASPPAWTNYIFSYSPTNRPGHCVVTPDGHRYGYMDLEYYTEHNPNRDVNRMLDAIINYYNTVWLDQFGHTKMKITHDSFLILTASNQEKESFHLHGPFEYAFPDQRHLLYFMNQVHELVQADKSKIGIVNKSYYVRGERKMVQESFLDMMPYGSSGELCFRTYLCTKDGRVLKMVDKQDQLSRLVERNKIFAPLRNVDDEQTIDRFMFEKSIVQLVPKGTPLVQIDEKLLPAAKKKKGVKMEIERKRGFFVLKEKKTDSIETATHVEITDDGIQYRVIAPNAYHYIFTCMVKSMDNIKEYYGTCEVMTDTTKLVVEMKTENELDEKIIRDIQQIVKSKFTDEDTSCLCFMTAHTKYRIVWPNVHVEKKTTGPELTLAIKHEIDQLHDVVIDEQVYERGYVSCYGSRLLEIDPEEETMRLYQCSFIGEYDDQGNKKNEEILPIDLLKKASVRL